MLPAAGHARQLIEILEPNQAALEGDRGSDGRRLHDIEQVLLGAAFGGEVKNAATLECSPMWFSNLHRLELTTSVTNICN
jgi:hypothetical protein